MKATGLVRRIDDLGRVVIPKEIRRALRIREGDPLELFIETDGVLLKKYSPIGKLGDFASEYADTLYESTGHIACIADCDVIIAVSGAPKKEFLDEPVSTIVEEAIEDRKIVLISQSGCDACPTKKDEGKYKFTAQVIAPIIVEGDPIGAVILSSKDPGISMGDMEVKVAKTAASFLAKQVEQ
jgi:AbrB family transcriptional regulator (stage V sporulation protein T)